MNADNISRLTKAPSGWAWSLTLLSCALVVATAFTSHPAVLVLLAVSVPLTIAAAIQVTCVAPLAAEVLRLREELANRHG